MPTDTMDLETARAVIAADREQKEQARRVELSAYAGRFFKYRNCYSCPEKESDYWWLYRAITGLADEGAYLNGWAFQRSVSGIVTIEPSQFGYEPDESYVEITADEFWAAANKLHLDIGAVLLAGEPR
ncbi:MAG: hypothetical protein JWL61_4050 [Gemmatimonadetes bacterium]|nr:hypothetical protein [Gemmatimonadota bacterium]